MRLSVDLPADLYAPLAKHAHRETMRIGRRVTHAEIMRNALADYLGQQRPEPLTKIPKSLRDSGETLQSQPFPMKRTTDPPSDQEPE
jgi:hypothetical protein